MSSEQTASVLGALAVILALAHVLGEAFARMKQPRLLGEMLAGVLVGPFALGSLYPEASERILRGGATAGTSHEHALGFLYWLGLLLLMFISGTEARRLLAPENRRPTFWILAVGTPLPFLAAMALGSLLDTDVLAGPAGRGLPVLLILSIAVAVTSIPVISRIFHDLGILHTRFASLVIGAAMLQDIALWAVLAIATGLAAGGDSPAGHIAATLLFMAAGFALAPALLRRLHDCRFNLVKDSSPAGYAALILLAYGGIAAAAGVNLMFAAFLAGFGLVGGIGGSHREDFAAPIDALRKVAMGVFIPVYFALVGARLEFGAGFSWTILLAFLFGSSLLSFASTGIAARLAGFRSMEAANLAAAFNARGGPGIVLASVAYEGGLINGAFFTSLVVTAVLTSQLAGVWIGARLRRGEPLLEGDLPHGSRPAG